MTAIRIMARLSVLVSALPGIFAGCCLPPPTPGPPCGSADSSVCYVSPDGNDNNPGTLDRPWRTIQKAADTLTAGQTAHIGGGTYHERVVVRNSGDAGRYITYAACPGEVVTIDGNGIAVPEDEGLFHISGRSFIRVSGLRVINSAYAGIYADHSAYLTVENTSTRNTASSGIGIWSCSQITISGNEVALGCSNGMQELLTVAGTNTFEVRNNHVYNDGAGYHKEGICIKDGSSNGRVFGNYVHHTEAVGLYVDAWDKLTSNISVYANTVHDSSIGVGLACESGGRLEHIRVCNNIAYHNRTVGIWVSACCPPVTAHPMNDIKIVNNTLYKNGQGQWGGGIGVENQDVQNVIIRNNLCSQNLSFQIAVDAGIPAHAVTVDHNLIDGYRGGEDEIYGNAWVEGSPGFAAPGSADFHLLSGSPAIDAGSPIDAPADDFEGGARPQDGNHDGSIGFDIGGYEAPP